MSTSTTSLLSAETRLRLRREALRAALMQGRTREAAWAASRLRLAGVELGPAEARAARAALLRFGRALRSARYRLAEPATRSTSMAAMAISATPRRRELRVWIALGLVALVIGVLGRPGEPARTDDDGAAPAVAAATPVPPIRGRTQPSAAAVVLALAPVTVEPSPDAAPVPSALPTAAGDSRGDPGTSASVVPANRTIVAPVQATPPRPPTATPSPTPVAIPPAAARVPTGPDGLSHVSGRVVDVVTDRPVANALVCIANGDAACTRAPRTDLDGRWTITLMPSSSWSVQFIANGYVTSNQRVLARLGSFLVPDIRVVPKT